MHAHADAGTYEDCIQRKTATLFRTSCITSNYQQVIGINRFMIIYYKNSVINLFHKFTINAQYTAINFFLTRVACKTFSHRTRNNRPIHQVISDLLFTKFLTEVPKKSTNDLYLSLYAELANR